MDYENMRVHDYLSFNRSQPDRQVPSAAEPAKVIEGIPDTTFQRARDDVTDSGLLQSHFL